MKKFLSVVAAIGLSTPASSAVVSCGMKTIEPKDVDIKDGIATVTIKGLKMDGDFTNFKDLIKSYGVFKTDNKTEDNKSVILTMTPLNATGGTKLWQNASYDFVVTFTAPTSEEGTSGSYYFGSINDNKLWSIKYKLEWELPSSN